MRFQRFINNLLKESKELISSDFKYSWLDLSGTFHPLQNQIHAQYANIYVYQTNFDKFKNDIQKHGTKRGQEILMTKGWQRIQFNNKNLYCNNGFGIFPNNLQKRNLIDLAIFQNMEKLIFDNDEDFKIIWEQE